MLISHAVPAIQIQFADKNYCSFELEGLVVVVIFKENF